MDGTFLKPIDTTGNWRLRIVLLACGDVAEVCVLIGD